LCIDTTHIDHHGLLLYPLDTEIDTIFTFLAGMADTPYFSSSAIDFGSALSQITVSLPISFRISAASKSFVSPRSYSSPNT